MRTWVAFCIVMFVLTSYASPMLRGQTSSPPNPSSPVTQVSGSVPAANPANPSQAAVAITTVPSPASPQHVPEQVMWALAMSYAMAYLTKKGWLSFLTPASTARVKAAAGFLVAAGTAAGIHFAVSGSLMDGHGASLTITGLSMDAIKDIGFQWVSQQAWYDGLVKRMATPQ